MQSLKKYNIGNPSNISYKNLISSYLLDKVDDSVLNIVKSLFSEKVNKANQEIILEPHLTLNSLKKVSEFSWLNEVKPYLWDTSKGSLDDLKHFIDTNIVDTECQVDLPFKRVLSLDLETTGLERTYRRFGGELIVSNCIIGVGLGFVGKDGTYGVYIPIGHINSNNFNINEVLNLISFLFDNYTVVVHNAPFDFEMLRIHGLSTPYVYYDTKIMAIHVGLRKTHMDKIGLKHLSHTLLGRKMLEIDQVANDAELFRVKAENVLAYTAADVINTIELFNLFIKNENIIRQHKILLLDIEAMAYSDSMNRANTPVHMSKTIKSLLTCVYRAYIVENKILDLVKGSIENINSESQVGMFIYDTIRKDYYNAGMPADKLNKILQDKINMIVKTRTLKNGDKLVVNCDKDVLGNLIKNIDSFTFMSDDNKHLLKYLAEYTLKFRSILHSLNIVYKLYRYSYVDDTKIHKVGLGLNFMGALTTRYTNESGKGCDRVEFTNNTKGLKGKFVRGNGLCGLNAQGLPSEYKRTMPAKKIVRNPSLDDKLNNINDIVDGLLKKILMFDGYL